MQLKVDFSPDTILVSKNDLKSVIREMMGEIQLEKASEDVLTIQATAEYLKISVPYLRELIRNKEIPHFQKGKVIRFCRTELLEWMSKQNEEATGLTPNLNSLRR